MGGFHSQSGWLTFIAVALGTVAVTHRMPFFAVRDPSAEAVAQGSDATAAYLGPLMALLAITMITGLFSSGFDWLYPARVLGTAAALWFFWKKSGILHRLARGWSLSAVGIGVAVFVIWMGLEWAMPGTTATSPIPTSLAEIPAGLAAGWLLFRVLGSATTVPIAEELAFRGYLLRRLISANFDDLSPRWFPWLSFVVSSVRFGALHGRWLAGTVAGMCYAWARSRRGRVEDAIVAHTTTNVLIAADVLITGNWGLWA